MQMNPKNLVMLFALCLIAPSILASPPVSYVRVPAAAFFPVDSTEGYSSFTVGGARFGGDDGTVLQAPVQLPSGARLVSLELDFVDTNATISVQGSLLACDSLLQNCTYLPIAGAGPGDCSSPGYICSGNGFQSGAGSMSADLSPDDITVDNDTKSYSLVAITTNAMGGIAGMRVGYLPPAILSPLTATFVDVPTDHPFFKFIEALYASGLTAGCGVNPARFCPEEPMTRGQAAVFLTLGLGLQ